MLSNLTASGWVLFALWILIAVLTGMQMFVSVSKRERDMNFGLVVVFAALTAWLLWLVTP